MTARGGKAGGGELMNAYDSERAEIEIKKGTDNDETLYRNSRKSV